MYTKHKWESDTHFNFEYIRYLPKDYDENKKNPLVFFLHGAGERGSNVEDTARYGFMKNVREGKEYPFIYVSPQCPGDKYWGRYIESLIAFLDYICDTLPIDKDRIYLTGLSMGGTGTWLLSMAEPERFAAIAPVCGTGIYWYGCRMTRVPIYMFHGDCDDIVPVTESVSMLNAVNKNGGNARLKIVNGGGHDIYEWVFNDDLVDWFLSHKLS